MKLASVLCVAVAIGLVCGAQATLPYPFSTSCAQKPAVYSVNPVVTYKPNNTYCFTIEVNVPPGCAGYCCSADLKKFELNINPSCKIGGAKLSATLNGKPTPTAPTIDKAPNEPAGAILRITNLGLKMADADGAEICVTLGANSAGQGCLSLETLCVPPPGGQIGQCQTSLWDSKFDCCPVDIVPPTPPSPIRPPINCSCNYMPSTTPFMLGGSPTEAPTTKNTTVYCFPITTDTPTVDGGCGPVDTLLKIEMFAKQALSGSIKRLFLNSSAGVSTTLSASWNGAGSNTLKFTPINWSTAQATDANVCLELKKPTTLSDLCFGTYCYLFFFNTNRNCCPMYAISP